MQPGQFEPGTCQVRAWNLSSAQKRREASRPLSFEVQFASGVAQASLLAHSGCPWGGRGQALFQEPGDSAACRSEGVRVYGKKRRPGVVALHISAESDASSTWTCAQLTMAEGSHTSTRLGVHCCSPRRGDEQLLVHCIRVRLYWRVLVAPYDRTSRDETDELPSPRLARRRAARQSLISWLVRI